MKFGKGKGRQFVFVNLRLFFLRTPSNSELRCRHMSEACIHLHSFVFVHLRTEREVEALLQQMFNFKQQNLRNAHKEKKQLPVKARPSFCKVDRLLSENSAGRDALTDFVSWRLSIYSNPHSVIDSAEKITLRLNRCAKTCLRANGI